MMTFYAIRLDLELDEPTGIFTVTSPDIPGLLTEGSTPTEILANVQEVLADLLEIWTELGQEIPPALQQQQIQRHQSVELLVAV